MDRLRRIKLTPSAVSHSIAQLERELRVPLLYRTTRQSWLTEAALCALANRPALSERSERQWRVYASIQSGRSGKCARLSIAFLPNAPIRPA
jgi:DNA-binding transcriptional LysR family regulator